MTTPPPNPLHPAPGDPGAVPQDPLAIATSPMRMKAVCNLLSFYQDLMDAGVPLIFLAPLGKKPARGTVRASLIDPDMTTEDIGFEILNHGWNVGMVTHLADLPGRNPLGIEVLDLDSADHGLDLTPFDGLKTQRHGEETRCHLWFRRPNPAEPRRGSHKTGEGAYDLMPWLVVLPGSIKPDGSIYTLFCPTPNGWQEYRGGSVKLTDLPIVDPEPYRPKRAPATFQGHGELAGKPFLTHPGDLRAREIAARMYIRNCIRHGIVSKSGQGGRGTLVKIASHLMAYLRLPVETAYKYLTEELLQSGESRRPPGSGADSGMEGSLSSTKPGSVRSWNASCTNAADGKPFPWIREELEEALAWGATSVPIYGVIAYEERQRKNHVKDCLRHFIKCLKQATAFQNTPPGASVRSRELWKLFLMLYGLDEALCTIQRFGTALTSAIQQEVLILHKGQRTKKKLVHYDGITAEIVEQVFSVFTETNPIPPAPQPFQATASTSGAA